MPRQKLKKTLDRIGLLRPAFRLNEHLRALKVGWRKPDGELSVFDDGLPVPPPALLVAIGGATTPAAYLHGGRRIADEITRTLTRHGVDMPSLSAILDFGCGSGRIIRNLRHLVPSLRLHGCDCNPELVEWCRRSLPFATFDLNQLAPPLSYQPGQFDLTYAFSVFTHLPAALQIDWLDELRRILTPGGHLLFTVHGDLAARELEATERQAFARGECVVRYQRAAGTNLCAAFHPEPFIRETLARGWDYVDAFDSHAGQRFVLFRRPVAPRPLGREAAS